MKLILSLHSNRNLTGWPALKWWTNPHLQSLAQLIAFNTMRLEQRRWTQVDNNPKSSPEMACKGCRISHSYGLRGQKNYLAVKLQHSNCGIAPLRKSMSKTQRRYPAWNWQVVWWCTSQWYLAMGKIETARHPMDRDGSHEQYHTWDKDLFQGHLLEPPPSVKIEVSLNSQILCQIWTCLKWSSQLSSALHPWHSGIYTQQNPVLTVMRTIGK